MSYDKLCNHIIKIDDMINFFNIEIEGHSIENEFKNHIVIGSVIQSFYTGIELILTEILKREHNITVNGKSFHKETLEESVKLSIIDSYEYKILIDYLGGSDIYLEKFI